MKLQHKIVLFMIGILVIVIGGIGVLTFKQVENTIENQMGNNAMDLAVTIASMDRIKEALGDSKDYTIIQETVEKVRKRTRFQYIIVMDMDGIKYSYPIEHGLGKKYISGGEEKVLKTGQAYVSEDKNVLISAIRAFVPVYYNEKQIGAVVVGLLTDRVYDEIRPHIFIFKLTLVIGLLIGVIGATLLSLNIKRTIFGLEPKEIAVLLGQRENVLQSLKNGILAINQNGDITLFNKIAQDVIGLKEDDVGKNISKFKSSYMNQMMDVLKTKKSVYNEEVKISSNKLLLCSHTLLWNHKDEIIGVVTSFQDLTEVKEMAEELTGIKKMTYALRAQNHEFMNKLHTISGLIQLEAYDEAVDYIELISEQRQEISEILNYKIKNPHVAAILLAKYNKATEAKISLEIDPDSNLDNIPKGIMVDEICSVIGNLIENAIDELVKIENGVIRVRLNSDDKGLKIWIEDNGLGIDESIRNKIFEKGITTKNGNRGIGLSIVKRIIDSAGGTIEIIEKNGVVWDIYIPMERRIPYVECSYSGR
ncbi:MAG: sensor histidine kinase [Marinisporobacter sp.]|nr:sensor histidine kinase [Marinisporobacter sp.]